MGADWNELTNDQVRDAWLWIHLGFQPSTSPSGRGRREVEENRALLVLGALERYVHVSRPFYGIGHIGQSGK